jgi:hypothetical protein
MNLKKKEINNMEKTLIQWQKRWEKLFQNVRLKWTNQLSPEIVAFFNDIKWVYGEGRTYGTLSYTLYFKSKGETWELVVQKSVISESIKNFYIKKYNKEYYLLTYGLGNLKSRKPIQTNDEAQIIIDFFEEIGDEMIKASMDIDEERKMNEREQFDKVMEEITVVGYDKKYEELILSNGKRMPVSGMYHEIAKERKGMILNGKRFD